MSIDPDQLDAHLKELRRGSVLLACLLALRTPDYGYGLLERLNGMQLDVDANTLYPLLRRLEKQDLLTSEWDTEGTRPRKYYSTSELGEELAETLIVSWNEMAAALIQLYEGKK